MLWGVWRRKAGSKPQQMRAIMAGDWQHCSHTCAEWLPPETNGTRRTTQADSRKPYVERTTLCLSVLLAASLAVLRFAAGRRVAGRSPGPRLTFSDAGQHRRHGDGRRRRAASPASKCRFTVSSGMEAGGRSVH